MAINTLYRKCADLITMVALSVAQEYFIVGLAVGLGLGFGISLCIAVIRWMSR